MTEKDDSTKKKKKSIIASLDLKNYKPKYTDSYGLGKPNEIDLDNFLIAEPDKNNESQKSEENFVESNSNVVNSVIDEVKPPKVTSSTEKSSVEDKPIDNKPIENKSEDKFADKKAEDKIIAEALKPSKVDNDFERRVNAEAENDFYDDKPVQKIGDNFRSNIIDRKTDDNSNADSTSNEGKGNRKINLREPIKVNIRHEIREQFNQLEEVLNNAEEKKSPPRRTETYGIVISAVALVYSIAAADKALFFLSISLLTYLARPIIAAPFGKYNQSIQNALKGFSIVLFFGAIFFAFF
ncbi:MAG: hypothetical protein IJ728_02455 [Selenomonadaceae bacterium]|nr:hypothetical protein [Selenomonadaceae bacterium]